MAVRRNRVVMSCALRRAHNVSARVSGSVRTDSLSFGGVGVAGPHRGALARTRTAGNAPRRSIDNPFLGVGVAAGERAAAAENN